MQSTSDVGGMNCSIWDFHVTANSIIRYSCRNMEFGANNTILSALYELYPKNIIYQANFSTIGNETRGQIETWSIETIEQCVDAPLINASKVNMQDFLYNGTGLLCLKHAPVLTLSPIIKASILIIVAILSLVGNLATIISIKRRQNRGRARPSWTAIYSLIFQLSIADLLVTLFCLIGEASWFFTVQWYAGNIGCKVFKFLQVAALYLSTFVLVLIGVDRWLAVRYPLRSMATATRSKRLITLAWVLSGLLSIPQAVIFSVQRGPFIEEFYQCVTHGFYGKTWQEQAYTTFSLVFMFILPLVILVSTYVSTVKTIAQSERIFNPEIRGQERYLAADLNRRRLIHRAKMKSLRMSVVIVAAFLVWWTPYYAMMIIFIFLNPSEAQTEGLLNGIFFFGMSNSLVNPVIYGAFHLWPKRRGNRDRESGGQQASLLRRGDNNTSSVRLTTVRSMRSSAKYSLGQNANLL